MHCTRRKEGLSLKRIIACLVMVRAQWKGAISQYVAHKGRHCSSSCRDWARWFACIERPEAKDYCHGELPSCEGSNIPANFILYV